MCARMLCEGAAAESTLPPSSSNTAAVFDGRSAAATMFATTLGKSYVDLGATRAAPPTSRTMMDASFVDVTNSPVDADGFEIVAKAAAE